MARPWIRWSGTGTPTTPSPPTIPPTHHCVQEKGCILSGPWLIEMCHSVHVRSASAGILHLKCCVWHVVWNVRPHLKLVRPVSLLREMFGLALLLVWGLALLLIWRCAVLQSQQWAAEVCTMQKKSNPTEVGTAFFSKGIAIFLRPKLTADILKPVFYYSAKCEKQGKKSSPFPWCMFSSTDQNSLYVVDIRYQLPFSSVHLVHSLLCNLVCVIIYMWHEIYYALFSSFFNKKNQMFLCVCSCLWGRIVGWVMGLHYVVTQNLMALAIFKVYSPLKLK